MKLSIVILAAFGIAGCTNVLEPWETEELRRAESLWKSKNIDDYSYEMRASCFCGEEVTSWAVVEVRDDQVVSARTLTGQPLTGFALSSRMTVNELFDRAKDRPDWLASIDFEFHDDLGYPLMLSLTSKKNIQDAGVTYETRNLTPVSQ